MIQVIFINLGLTLSIMLSLWALSMWLRNASIVDVFWGAGFVLIGWSTLGQHQLGHGATERGTLLTALVTVWGLRLTAYLMWRNWGAPEDFRYQAMREKHGARFPWVSLGTVFMLQGVLMWWVSLPVQVGSHGEAPLSWLDGVGVALWAVGLIFEAVGDLQLARFKADPANRGRVMDRGLWRFTRHPNYFGDFCVWWGVYLIAASSPIGWTTLGSPLVMSVLLLKVSGVALLERGITARRPEYADYIERTSAFFPWPPQAKRGSSGG